MYVYDDNIVVSFTRGEFDLKANEGLNVSFLLEQILANHTLFVMQLCKSKFICT